MSYYGKLPRVVDILPARVKEMMFYQDMPIRLAEGPQHCILESRLAVFAPVISRAIDDFKENFGLQRLDASNIYVSAKRAFEAPGRPFNRPGWHSDGFMSDDINYIWTDGTPTLFNSSNFNLTPDHDLSMFEMAQQAIKVNDISFPPFYLLQLDQFNIHRVGDIEKPGIRTFLKVTFSPDRYDLEGNTHNYGLVYDWEMFPRGAERNTPQTKTKK